MNMIRFFRFTIAAALLALCPGPRAFAQCCVNIAGSWEVDEEADFTIYMNGEFYDEFSRSGSGTVSISQDGCSIRFYSQVPNPLGPGTLRLLRTGTVNGRTVTWSGAVATAIQGVSCPTNILRGTGTIRPFFSGATIDFTTTGTLYCTDGRDRALIRVRGSATFSTGRDLLFPPSVDVVPASRSVTTGLAADGTRLAGSNVTFSATVSENGNYGYRWLHNGQPILGATNAVLVLSNVTSAAAGTYTVEVRAGNCRITDTATLIVNDSAVPDTTPPMLTILHPLNAALRLSTNNPTFVLRGTARDNRGVAGVYLQANGTPFAAVSGTSNWSAAVQLEPGSNVFHLKAVDAAGNSSPVLTRTVNFVVTSPLTVRTNGRGYVLPALDGQLLEIGRNYTATATPSNGWLFSHWAGGVASSAPRLTFAMQSNLVLEAHFVPNLFLTATGAYHGLFRDPNQPQHASSGAFKAMVGRGGEFSASLRSGSRLSSFTGRFGLDGKATNRVPRSGTNALTVELCLDLQGADRITGRVTDGAWVAELGANRAVFNSTSNLATNFAGRYTLLIAGATNGSSVAPAGHGFQTLAISRAGIATFSGTLADGTPATAQVPLSRAGDLPWYVPLYGGTGSALGWMRVRPSAAVDLDGSTDWFKPARATPPNYTNGFAISSPVSGSAYAPIGTNRLLQLDEALVVLSDGGLPQSLTNVVTLGPGGRVTNGGPHRLTFQAAPATGMFSGTLTPVGATAPIAFKGALLQRQGFGGGFFLRGGQSGAVNIGP